MGSTASTNLSTLEEVGGRSALPDSFLFGRVLFRGSGDGFQELERNQIEARLAIRPPGTTNETPDVAPLFMLNLAHSHMLPQR